jgi:hypothetical protein
MKVSTLQDIYPELFLLSIVNYVKLRRLQWAGHVLRMPEERIPRKVMMGRLEGVRPIGRPRKR